MSSSVIIDVKDLAVTIDDKSILQHISFALNTGDILGLVGPSGCGKTTLLNTVAGFLAPSAGALKIADLPEISPRAPLSPEKRKIGVIFQDYALFPHMTVAENIAYGIHQLTKVQQLEKVTELTALLKLEGFEDRYPHQLSGGQQQRVAIARALAPEPSLLLLDEPFSNIDARLRNELMIELRILLKKLGMTAIFVTHNKDEVFTFADKMAVLHDGQVLQFGPPVEVCQQPKSWQVADFLQLGSWLDATLYKDNLDTPLGLLSINREDNEPTTTVQLLLKPQHITINPDEYGESVVHHINVTEQGYQYIMVSHSAEHHYQLTVYSQDYLALGQRAQLTINAHDYILFSKS